MAMAMRALIKASDSFMIDDTQDGEPNKEFS